MEEDKKQESDSFLEDLKRSIRLRLGNKLIFSYIITWCIWNWKFLFFIIFSGKPVELKLSTYSKYFSTYDAFMPIIGVVFYYLILDWFEGIFLSISQKGVNFRLQRHTEIERLKIEAEIEISKKRLNIITEFAQTNKQELNQAVEINEKLKKLERTTNELQVRMQNVKTIS